VVFECTDICLNTKCAIKFTLDKNLCIKEYITMLTINAIAKNETKMVKAYAHGYVHVKDPLLTVYGQENDD